MRLHRIVLAVLLVGGRYVMQLRDDKPGIAAPGLWGLFGGEVERGEEPSAAVLREVEEELSIRLTSCCFLFDVEDHLQASGDTAVYSLFEADMTRQWGLHHLREGQDVQHHAFVDLAQLKMPGVIRAVLDWHYQTRGSSGVEQLSPSARQG